MRVQPILPISELCAGVLATAVHHPESCPRAPFGLLCDRMTKTQPLQAAPTPTMKKPCPTPTSHPTDEAQLGCSLPRNKKSGLVVLLRQACGGGKKPPGEPSARHLAPGRPYRDITQAASAGIGGRQRLLVIDRK